MIHEQYLQMLKDLENDFNKERRKLAVRYAQANNPYKIGDIISDHSDTIKIENIGFDWGYNNNPSCVYTGVILKKDLTPNKLNKKTSIYQINIL